MEVNPPALSLSPRRWVPPQAVRHTNVRNGAGVLTRPTPTKFELFVQQKAAEAAVAPSEVEEFESWLAAEEGELARRVADVPSMTPRSAISRATEI